MWSSRNPKNVVQIYLGILCVTLALAQKPPIPCHLRWTPMPNTGILQDTISVHVNELFIGKIVRNGSHIVGNVNNLTMEAYFEDTAADGPTGIQLLNNPHNCTTSFISSVGWESKQNLLVGTLGSKLEYVGRALVSSSLGNKWMAGTLDPSTGKLRISGIPGTQPQEFDVFEVLQSSSPGLVLEVTNFIFYTDNAGEESDVSGIEIIENQSPATIEQTITHTKNVTEIYRTTITKKYVATRTTVKKTKILFFSKTKTTVDTYTDETRETTEHRESTVISVSKKITVPPYESLEACSEIIIKEEQEVPYSAIGRYTAPGLESKEVLSILKEDGIEGASVVGNEVHISVQGMFSYKLALTTNFKVNPVGASGGCIGEATRNGIRIRF